MNDREEAFGEERLRRLISEWRTLSAREMVRKVEDEILLFSGEQPRFDDMTLVILKVL